MGKITFFRNLKCAFFLTSAELLTWVICFRKKNNCEGY